MNTCTPLAIALADELERSWKFYGEQHMKSATELRRLHAENEAAHTVGILQEKELMRLETENETLREALRIARDHIEMDALEISHCKDAAMIRAALTRVGEVK